MVDATDASSYHRHQSVNRSIDQSINQSVNQSINQSSTPTLTTTTKTTTITTTPPDATAEASAGGALPVPYPQWLDILRALKSCFRPPAHATDGAARPHAPPPRQPGQPSPIDTLGLGLGLVGESISTIKIPSLGGRSHVGGQGEGMAPTTATGGRIRSVKSVSQSVRRGGRCDLRMYNQSSVGEGVGRKKCLFQNSGPDTTSLFRIHPPPPHFSPHRPERARRADLRRRRGHDDSAFHSFSTHDNASSGNGSNGNNKGGGTPSFSSSSPAASSSSSSSSSHSSPGLGAVAGAEGYEPLPSTRGPRARPALASTMEGGDSSSTPILRPPSQQPQQPQQQQQRRAPSSINTYGTVNSAVAAAAPAAPAALPPKHLRGVPSRIKPQLDARRRALLEQRRQGLGGRQRQQEQQAQEREQAAPAVSVDA